MRNTTTLLVRNLIVLLFVSVSATSMAQDSYVQLIVEWENRAPEYQVRFRDRFNNFFGPTICAPTGCLQNGTGSYYATFDIGCVDQVNGGQNYDIVLYDEDPNGPGVLDNWAAGDQVTLIVDGDATVFRKGQPGGFNIGANGRGYNFFPGGGTDNGCDRRDIDVRGGADNLIIVDGDTTPRQIDNTDFGDVSVGASVTTDFVIHNEADQENLLVQNYQIIGADAAQFAINGATGNLGAGGTRNFQVTYTPTNGGVHNATVRVQSNDRDDEDIYTFDITGFGNEAEIAVRGNALNGPTAVNIVDGDITPQVPDDTDFGTTTIGTPVDGNFWVINFGAQQLNVSNVQITGPGAAQFQITQAPATTVNSFTGSLMIVQYNPTVAGTHEATIEITNNDIDENPFDFSIIGRAGGAEPDIAVSGNGLNIGNNDFTPQVADNTDYGSTLVGTPVLNDFLVRNFGTATLSFSNVSIQGPDAGQWQITQNVGASIVAGGNATLGITYNPTAIGNHTATVRIVSNDPDESPFEYRIIGNAVVPQPDIAVSGNFINIANNDTTPVAADNTDWGVVFVGNTITNTFRIDNVGLANLDLTGAPLVALTGSADFAVTALPGNSVAFGNFTIFEITYTPTGAGVDTATVSIATNDPDENPFTFTIRGNGQNAPREIQIESNELEIPDGDVTPITADNTKFESIEQGNIVDRRFLLRNVGGTTLNVLGGAPYVLITGPGAAFFSVTTAPATVVAPFTQTFFEITFDASTLGTHTATVTILSNDADEAIYNFNIEATAVKPQIALYYENFDDGPAGYTVVNEAGTTTWTHGDPASIPSEKSIWYTSPYDNYTNDSATILYSPSIDLSLAREMVFHMHLFVDTESTWDGMKVQYSANGASWNDLGAIGSGTNWYNSTVAGLDNEVNVQNREGWSGTLYGGSNAGADSDFIEAKVALPAALDGDNSVFFRFIFESDDQVTDNGVAIDNIRITGTPITPTPALVGPGDVNTNLNLWLRATDSPYTDGQTLASWEDIARSNDARSETGARPSFENNAAENINFNPVVKFDRAQQEHMRGAGGVYSDDYWVVVRSNLIVDNSLATETMYLGAAAAPEGFSRDPSGLGTGTVSDRFDDEVIAHSIGTVPDALGTDSYSYGRAFVSSSETFDNVLILNVKNNPANDGSEIYLNGKRIDNSDGFTTATNEALPYEEYLNEQYYLGVGRYTLNELPFESHLDGAMTEVLSYSTRNTEQDQQKIYSYLALKNGVSLQSANSTLPRRQADRDYIDSAGNVIWDASANIQYNYDVAGIGRDDASELGQKQSKSIHPEATLNVGLTTLEERNDDNTANFTNDREFLVWGHNGLGMDTSSSPIAINLGPTTTTTVTEVTDRRWKINETGGDVGPVTVGVKTTDLVNLPPLVGEDAYVMLVSSDPNFVTDVETIFLNEDAGMQKAVYDFDGDMYFVFGVAHETIELRRMQFDGVDDRLIVTDGYNVDGTYSMSAWVRHTGANSSNNDRTILAKRSLPGVGGIHLFLGNDNRVRIWHSGVNGDQATAGNTPIAAGEWRHVAITYDATSRNLNMYIDGVLDKTVVNMREANAGDGTLSIGTWYRNKTDIRNHWNGDLDEIRIWDTELNEEQIRYIMNQEILEDANKVNGRFLPNTVTKDPVNLIDWSSLQAYYNMNTYIGTYLNDASDNNARARLVVPNFFSVELQTAPVPYVSRAAGDWDADATWENGGVQPSPGSQRTINGNVEDINWNIVVTSHDVDLNRTAQVNALVVESDELTVNNDSGLTVDYYLDLDGEIDLEGESQLVQTEDSDLTTTSAGRIQRDQQGTGNTYWYNYWSSPVSPVSTTSNNNDFTISGSILDATNPAAPVSAIFTTGYNGQSGTPVTLSESWMYKFSNLTDQYSNWQYVGAFGTMKVGEGWTMKGTDTAGEQNYAFEGKPNNGSITLPITNANSYLVGNPYASALDAHKFINDNTNLEGTLYFWEHWGGNNHVLQDYQGGYATYNLSGSVPTATLGTSDPLVNSGGTPTKIPGRYIPVAQGFFVDATANGTVDFNNSQRAFVTEATGDSQFVRGQVSNVTAPTGADAINTAWDTRVKIRFGYDSPNTIHRQLLLVEDANTTVGFDRAYDGPMADSQYDDFAFLINNEDHVIQAIPAFDVSAQLPVMVKMRDAGTFDLSIYDVENDPGASLKVYLWDTQLDTYHDLRASSYTSPTMAAGIDNTRFIIVFDQQNTLSNDEVVLTNTVVFQPEADVLGIHQGAHDARIESVSLYSITGQLIKTYDVVNQQGDILLDVKSLATGTYVIKMDAGDQIDSRQVIIE